MMKTADTSLLEFATSQQRRHDAKSCPVDRKEKGPFGTPAEIAEFMAGIFPRLPAEKLRESGDVLERSDGAQTVRT